jgi:hypothetical protein
MNYFILVQNHHQDHRHLSRNQSLRIPLEERHQYDSAHVDGAHIRFDFPSVRIIIPNHRPAAVFRSRLRRDRQHCCADARCQCLLHFSLSFAEKETEIATAQKISLATIM